MNSKARMGAATVCLLIGMAALVLVIIRLTDDNSDAAAGPETSPTADPAAAEAPSEPGTPAPETVPFQGWPPSVEVRPLAFGDPGTEPPTDLSDVASGLYLWSDFSGWHLWSVGATDPVQGLLVVNGTFGDVVSEGPVPAEHSIEEDGKVVAFTLQPGTGISGLRFNPGFFTETIELTVAGEAPTLRTGASMVDAPLPVTIRKGQPVPTP